MRSSRNYSVLFCLLGVALYGGLTAENAAAKGKPPSYEIIPFLPPDFKSASSQVLGLNNMSHAVGWAERMNGENQAVHLDIVTAQYTSLAGGAFATGVNNLNQIVGASSAGGLLLGAFWSGPSADPVPLPPLLGDVESSAGGINDAGIVVGESDDPSGRRLAVVWRVTVDADGVAHVDGPQPLAPLNGDSGCWGYDLNEMADNVTQVVGTSINTSLYGFEVHEGVVWTVSLNGDGTLAAPGAPIGLGMLGLDNPSSSLAGGINQSGAVCGTSDGLAVLAPPDGQFQPLKLAPRMVRGIGNDVNDLGHAVGLQWKNFGDDHAYLWVDGNPIELERHIPRLSGWDKLRWASRINKDGIIAGWGAYDVYERGFLLIPK